MYETQEYHEPNRHSKFVYIFVIRASKKLNWLNNNKRSFRVCFVVILHFSVFIPFCTRFGMETQGKKKRAIDRSLMAQSLGNNNEQNVKISKIKRNNKIHYKNSSQARLLSRHNIFCALELDLKCAPLRSHTTRSHCCMRCQCL